MLHLIFLRDGTVVLSRVSYASWRDVQAAFDAYMTSLSFEEADALLAFLDDEYGEERAWLKPAEVAAWLASDARELAAPP